MQFTGYHMETPKLFFNTCEPVESNERLKRFKERNSVSIADRTFYTLKDDNGGELLLDSKWWELPLEDQPQLEAALAEYSKAVNGYGA